MCSKSEKLRFVRGEGIDWTPNNNKIAIMMKNRQLTDFQLSATVLAADHRYRAKNASLSAKADSRRCDASS